MREIHGMRRFFGIAFLWSNGGRYPSGLYENEEIWAARDRRFFLVSRSLSGRLDAKNAFPRCKMTIFVKMDR
ncbi:hypothetical protein D1872_291760 [compost metagenome]